MCYGEGKVGNRKNGQVLKNLRTNIQFYLLNSAKHGCIRKPCEITFLPKILFLSKKLCIFAHETPKVG